MERISFKSTKFEDIQIGPKIIAKEISPGRFEISCSCGWRVVSVDKFRLTNKDIEPVITAHFDMEHSGVYEKK